jgi:hypothetical protein
MAESRTTTQLYRWSDTLGMRNFSGSASMRAARSSFGNAKPIICSSRANAR